MEGFRRKTPEELLYSIFQIQKGRLKIYIGAVSGSGKTYHMLREGQSLKKQGIDVVLCAVSTMQRPETVEQLEGLERIPSLRWMKGDAEQKDLNIEALLERNPEVVLVDGLAHRNREGADRSTRLVDIQVLLNAGISVITTVNVYELEGANELARKLTGIEVKETVPPMALELADEVRLIDVTPETILERLSTGQMKAAYHRLYERGNLGKLREIALRLVAEGVNDSLEKHREENGLLGPSGAAERILVAVQYHWNGSIYVRRGQQIAKRLGGDLRIVSFAGPNKKLTEEAATFKRSIIQLTNKVGGQFEELPLTSRRSLPRELVHYAARNNVSRIVMGHSKMSAWQEWRKGSVVNGLLRRIRNVDLFFVADRSEKEGERILPTKSRKEKDSDRYKRLSSHELEEQIKKIRRGRFKVYIGAAPGVGKTYAMLREGNDLRRRGIDVVIGLLETHGRQETLAQIGSLQAIPRTEIPYRGTTMQEMDLEAIIARNPEVVLVDELAHTNVPGRVNSKRYEDVIELLNAGISVISTMNVQHLESLNDAVEQITGIRVRETVPDRLLRLADEVQLIDVAPTSLQQRMKEGKIYAMDKVGQALGSFFKTGNLIALRELALREIADDVDERLESWERKGALRGPWRRQETICVAVALSCNAERLIRRGFRIAHRLKAAWYVTFVQPEPQRTEEEAGRLEKLQQLTARLGGKFEIQTVDSRKKIAALLIAKADEYGGTQIIVGQSGRGFWHRLKHGNIVRTILRKARHMDVLVVADYDANGMAPHSQPL